MKKFERGADVHQIALIPRSVDEYVSSDDFVRYVDEVIEELDLSGLEEAYSFEGRPAYDPRILCKLLFYGKLRRVRSSRELARASRENLKFMFLCRNERPSHTTINEFRKQHCRRLASLLQETVRIGLEEGLITLEHVSIDGTKIRASVSKSSFRSPEELIKERAELEQQLLESLQEDIEEDEDDDFDDDPGLKINKEERQKRIRRSIHRKRQIDNALKHYEQIEGQKPKCVSTTDPESRMMKTDGFKPAYNMQAAVDRNSRMVVAGYATDARADQGQLSFMLEKIEQTAGDNPVQVAADAGYRETLGLVELARRGIDGYVPQPRSNQKVFPLEAFTYLEDSNTLSCPTGRTLKYNGFDKRKEARCYTSIDCSGCRLRTKCVQRNGKKRSVYISVHQPLIDEMREKVLSESGKRASKIRKSTVEPLFGVIKAARAGPRTLFRGLYRVSADWIQELVAINIEKLAKNKMQTA